ncbi:hypothetical protein B0H21DRAFT_776591 [Amylocystis lapponica]|nr:hypothetical protein B0H21DRAFT_776591 [Amylocystis lapponica]
MLVRGDLVHCTGLGHLHILHDHLLGKPCAFCTRDGHISHVGPAGEQESLALLEKTSDAPRVIPHGSFLLPTFCDLHLHAPQFLYQGTGLHLPLMEWLHEYAFKAEESLDADSTLARRVYTRLAQRLIENGTGAVLLFGTIKAETNLILAEVMQAAGIRAFVGKLSMDISTRPSYVEHSPDAALAAARAFADECASLVAHLPKHRQLVEPVLTPRFVPTCSDALLAGLGSLSEARGLRIQSHMAEAHDQMEWVKRERGVGDTDVFAQHKLLTPRTVQAHCTFLDEPALSRVAATGTAVAHCPLSNAYFSAEPFRLREALARGVAVGLGTDVAGGYSADVMNCMRHAVAVSRMREGSRVGRGDGGANLAVDWKEALYLATRGGALALGLPLESGTFAEGAPFDAQLIRMFDPRTGAGVGAMDFFENVTERKLTEDMVEKWWCLGDVRNRMETWVQGRKVRAYEDVLP